MTERIKFKVVATGEVPVPGKPWGEHYYEAWLWPVNEGSDEGHVPRGIKLAFANSEVREHFQLGLEYHVDFTLVESETTTVPQHPVESDNEVVETAEVTYQEASQPKTKVRKRKL
jgi:hypothetical protein